MRLDQAIDELRPSVVQMLAIRLAERRVLGTGFFVGSGRHVITARHVVDALPTGFTLAIGVPGVYVNTPEVQARGPFRLVGCRLVDVSEDPDLALLEADLPADQHSFGVTVDGELARAAGLRAPWTQLTRPILIRSSDVKEGLSVATSGFPLAAPALISTAGVIASAYAPPDPNDPNVGFRYLADMTAAGGNSGGPVYRVSDGSLVGVLVAGRLAPLPGGAAGAGTQLTQMIGLTLVTPVDDVVRLMARNGVERDRSKARPDLFGRNPKQRR